MEGLRAGPAAAGGVMATRSELAVNDHAWLTHPMIATVRRIDSTGVLLREYASEAESVGAVALADLLREQASDRKACDADR